MRSWTRSPADELISIFRAALDAAHPRARTAEHCTGLIGRGKCTLIALGKAAEAMTQGALDTLGADIVSGLVVGPGPASTRLPSIVGSHPHPDARSETAGRRLIQVVSASELPVLALISGGGSALAAVPAPGIALAEKVAATSAVMAAGATIRELNEVRKHLSALKGGRLAELARNGLITLAVSDVVGDDLSVIASGPTVPDSSTYSGAVNTCQRLAVWNGLPPPVREHLEAGVRGDLPETPLELDKVDAQVIAPLAAVARAALDDSDLRGFDARLSRSPMAATVAAECEAIASKVAALGPNEVAIEHGEPILRVHTGGGLGGRAHHLALMLARRLSGRDVTVLVAGTDGIDGSAPSAGAVVDGRTWERLRAVGQEPEAALAAFDSYRALATIGATLEIGRTGINHADLVLAVGAQGS